MNKIIPKFYKSASFILLGAIIRTLVRNTVQINDQIDFNGTQPWPKLANLYIRAGVPNLFDKMDWTAVIFVMGTGQ